MLYYLITTPKGIRTAKTQSPLLSKEVARELVNGPVCYWTRVGLGTYWFNKIFRDPVTKRA